MSNNKLIGFNIYQDEKNRTIYYDRFTKNAYLINKKDEKAYFFYTSRPVTAFALGYLVHYFFENIWLALFVAAATYLIMLFFFRTMFLRDLPTVSHFEKGKKEPILNRVAQSFTTGRIITIIIVALAVSVISVVNVIISHYEGFAKYANYAISLGAFIFAMFYVAVFIENKKNKKK